MFTLLKVELTEVPKLVTIVTQATKIKASMTAYSTAVGPSSLTRNFSTQFIRFFTVINSLGRDGLSSRAWQHTTQLSSRSSISPLEGTVGHDFRGCK